MTNCEKERTRIFEVIKEKGKRLTKQRQLLVQLILEFKSPFSAKELQTKVQKKENKAVDLVTIYRSLSLFVEWRILNTLDFSDGFTRYEYKNNKDKKGHHHHVICTSCKKIEPVDLCMLSNQHKFIESMGYKNVSHKLEFFGLCHACQM